jgi:hypothetical protein
MIGPLNESVFTIWRYSSQNTSFWCFTFIDNRPTEFLEYAFFWFAINTVELNFTGDLEYFPIEKDFDKQCTHSLKFYFTFSGKWLGFNDDRHFVVGTIVE